MRICTEPTPASARFRTTFAAVPRQNGPVLGKRLCITILVALCCLVVLAESALSAAEETGERPEKGLSKTFANVVVLSNDQLDSKAGYLQGIFPSEIVRQSILIAGRDGLGLKTRDAWLRGEVRLIENPASFPLTLKAEADKGGQVSIQLERAQPKGDSSRWSAKPFSVSEEGSLESLIEQCEALSRNEFVEALKAAGYQGKASRVVKSSPVSETTEQLIQQWNLIAQYTAIQDLHADIAMKGESPERLASLARAYSNLGSLTETLWSPAHKTFKVRGLLYAERLTERTSDSGWALAHRAYARALAGRHLSALEDISTIRKSAKQEAKAQRSIPKWLPLIEAYCAYQPDVLDNAIHDEQLKPLAIYLRTLNADPVNDQQQMLEQTVSLLTIEPACTRTLDDLCKANSLGIKRQATEQGMPRIWPQLYLKLLASNIDPKLKESIRTFLSTAEDLESEPQLRVKVTNSLLQSDDTTAEPSMNGLGQLLQEISFKQTCRQLTMLTDSLGFEVDEFLPGYQPLVTGHPFEKYIETFSSDSSQARAAFESFVETHDPREMHVDMVSLISHSYAKLSPKAYGRLYNEARKQIDAVYQDHQADSEWYKSMKTDRQRNNCARIAKTLQTISPHQPVTVAFSLATDEDYFKQHEEELLTKYDETPLVLEVLINKYRAEENVVRMESLLEKKLKIAPDHETLLKLAKCYLRRSDIEEWKKTLEQGLEMPSLGLSHGHIEKELADYYMSLGEWETAKPHAIQAAETYSAWGLRCAARCFEGLEDYQQSEALIQAFSLRYPTNATGWYFWCLRTQKGDVAAARKVAEEWMQAHPTANDDSEAVTRGLFQLTQGLKPEALKTYSEGFQKFNYPYLGMQAALLADELGQNDQRDELLAKVASRRSRDRELAELANRFQWMLKSPKNKWSPHWFQSLLTRAEQEEGVPTNLYYFAGKFLELHDEKTGGERYLHSAAESPMVYKYTCIMATLNLQQKKETLKARRTIELEPDHHKTRLLLNKAEYLTLAGRQKQAIEVLTEAQQLTPELTLVLNRRGQVYEALQDYGAAIADYQKAIEIDPTDWHAHNHIGLLYAACADPQFRNSSQGLHHARQAYDLLPTRYGITFSTQAIALAADGKFKRAIGRQKQALNLIPREEKEAAREKLKLFESGKPYYQTPVKD